jgi:ATP-dependent DNA ligase
LISLGNSERYEVIIRWAYELKSDGYRSVGLKTNGRVYLLSRSGNDFTGHSGAARIPRKSRPRP